MAKKLKQKCELTQTERILNVLRDNEVHTVPELIKRVYGQGKPSSARLAARIYSLRQSGHLIRSSAIAKGSTTWWYQLLDKHSIWKKSPLKPSGKRASTAANTLKPSTKTGGIATSANIVSIDDGQKVTVSSSKNKKRK